MYESRDELPSKNIYDTLEKGVGGKWCTFRGGEKQKKPSELEGQLKISLSPYNGYDWELITIISSNYCSVCNDGKGGLEDLSDDDRYSFFYYWLGTKVNGRFNVSDFRAIMTKIYEKLKEFDSKCKCTNIYNGISKDRFQKSKEVFDYYYNYKKLKGNNEECRYYCGNNECDAPFKAASTAYSELTSTCKNEGGESYCEVFKTKRNQREYGQPQQLDCSAPRPQAVETSTSSSGLPQVTEVSIKLPSELEYSGFDTRNHCTESRGKDLYCSLDLKEKVKVALSTWNNDENLAPRIVSNYYHACNKEKGKEDTATYYDPCKFLFFWIGDKIKDKFREKIQLSPLMGAIYKALEELPFSNTPKRKCTPIYSSITKDRFPEAKILFDYYYDYNKIQNGRVYSNYPCNDKYKSSYEKAETTYGKVKQECMSTSGDPYCTKFNEGKSKEDGEYAPPHKLPEQTCPQPLARTDQTDHEDRRGKHRIKLP
ncbi:Uncharacterized protein PCOAH_00047720 [Plasmodium coatneyi]|uniref:KIR protein n=1 Tax=Plasmodium coatneyi TaxID=208452 RepID=A0A1B1E6X1_9APIC|nr:Uncharacterized protein PCOAH_00047720 [Plasmodium coatneyi]ANQ10717.1 Uncharacterized protein PCOAH_00047720 [Plasmodium coatneyi]